MLALGVMYFLSPQLVVEAATEIVQISDETGTVQEFEVARRGYHKEVLGFFWRNESGNSDLDEPQGVRVEIARDRRSAALIVGSFAAVDGTITINTTLFDAASGNEIGSHTASGSDWLATVDDVSVAVLDYLEVEPSDNQSDDPLGQHFSGSLEAIRHFTNGVLSMAHYLSSDIEAARTTASRALKNGYRLSETSKFRLKANRYIFDGDFERGERVIEIWTRVQPNSAATMRPRPAT